MTARNSQGQIAAILLIAAALAVPVDAEARQNTQTDPAQTGGTQTSGTQTSGTETGEAAGSGQAGEQQTTTPVPEGVQQRQQTQPEAAAPATAPSGLLVPQEPAAPLLSAGVHAAPSTRPGRAFERPYRGLFGGSRVGPGQAGLFLRVSAYGGYDDNVLATQGGDRPEAQAGGYYTSGTGALEYARPGERLSLTGGASGEARYYDRFDDTATSGSAHGSVDFRLGRKNHVTARQMVARTELYRLGALPGLTAPGVPTPDAELNVFRRDRLVTESGVGFSRELTTKSTVSADYSYRQAQTEGAALDLHQHAAGATYQRQVGRFSNLRLGYHRQEAVYGAGETRRQVVINNIDLGGGYVRPLSFSRRTTLSVTGGTGMISREAAEGAPPVEYYRVTGTAALEHEVGRTWTMIGNYTRGLQFVEGFPEPFFLDSARVGISGLLRPRVELSSSFAYTDGRMQLSTRQNPYSSLAGTMRVGYSLSTSLELAVDYAYRQYQFDTTLGLPAAVAQDIGRHSVGIRLSYWRPLFTTR